MKIRTDFVTNSSSSSFITIKYAPGTLSEYMKEHGIEDFFRYIDGHLVDDCRNWDMSESLCKSLSKMVEPILEDYDNYDVGHFKYSKETVEQFLAFLKENREVIDKGTDCYLAWEQSTTEDGTYGSYQELQVKNGHGRIVKWPTKDGTINGDTLRNLYDEHDDYEYISHKLNKNMSGFNPEYWLRLFGENREDLKKDKPAEVLEKDKPEDDDWEKEYAYVREFDV